MVLSHVGRLVVLFVAAASIVSQGAGLVDVRLYGTWTVRVVVLTVLVGIFIFLLGCDRQDGPSWWSIPVVVVAAVLGLVAALAEPGRWNGWLLAGDHLRHLVLVADEWERGHLDYGTVYYPRGWHASVAMLWGTTGHGLTPEGLETLVTVLGVAVWTAAVALSAAAGVVAMSSIRRMGIRQRAALGFTGLVASALVWLPPIMGPTLALGFETSLVATLACLVALQELTSKQLVRSVVVVTASVIVVANTWQLLLPGLLVPIVVRWVAAWRDGSLRDRLAVIAASLLGFLASGAALLAVSQELGLSGAALTGDVRPLPAALATTASVLATGFAFIAWQRRASPEPAAILAVSALLFGWGFLLAALVGVSPSSYYPAKVHWSAVTIAIPVASAGIVAGLAWLNRQTGIWRTALVPCAVAAALLTMGGAAGPWLAFIGRWSTADGARAVAIATSPGASDARAVWTTGSDIDDRTARALLDFYRVDMADWTPLFIPASLAQDCAQLRLSSRPTVLSDHDPDRVRGKYACVSPIVVAPIEVSR